MSRSIQEIESFVQRFYGNQRMLITPFGYPVTFAALAQNATATAIVNIAANADFLFLAIRHRAQIGAAQTINTITAPFVRMLLSDSGTNEQYTNGAVDLVNQSTEGLYDHQLMYPRLISGRSALTMQVTNYAPTAETYTTLDVFLEGCLLRVQA